MKISTFSSSPIERSISITRVFAPPCQGPFKLPIAEVIDECMSDIEDAVAQGFAENLGHIEGTPEYDESVNMIKSIVPNQDLTRTGWR